MTGHQQAAMARAATTRGRAEAMMNTRKSQLTTQSARQIDTWEFRVLLVLAVACFFVVSLVTRLLPRGLRPFAASGRRESCFEEARRVAYAVIPYAFEW